ncbi:MAG: class I SAM-dependent methyltransferase [Planctomycetota bacterium]
MGLWDDHLLPRVIDLAMRGRTIQALRKRCVPEASGRVLEIGFGSGLNLPHYGDGVKELLALEPNETARKLSRKRVDAAPFPVEFVGLRGEEIPRGSGEVDEVVSTFTHCTIPDLDRALSEIRRVLKPGGTFRFLEHGLSPDEGVARTQRKWTPLQGKIFGGCHLDRDIDALVRSAGFEGSPAERFDAGRPRAVQHIHLGATQAS